MLRAQMHMKTARFPDTFSRETHPIYIDNYILLIYKPAIESNVCNRQNTDECVFDSYSSC